MDNDEAHTVIEFLQVKLKEGASPVRVRIVTKLKTLHAEIAEFELFVQYGQWIRAFLEEIIIPEMGEFLDPNSSFSDLATAVRRESDVHDWPMGPLQEKMIELCHRREVYGVLLNTRMLHVKCPRDFRTATEALQDVVDMDPFMWAALPDVGQSLANLIKTLG